MSEAADRAVALRMAGAGYSDIADRLDLTSAQVQELVAERLLDAGVESSDLTARLDMARLDTLLMAIWKPASRGDTTAVNQAVKIMGQRAALLARLDPPEDGEETSGPDLAETLAALKRAAVDN